MALASESLTSTQPGATAENQRSASSPPPASSNALPSTDSLPTRGGEQPGAFGRMIGCSVCGLPIRETKSKTGLCWKHVQQAYHPYRRRTAKETVCACGKSKRGKSKACLDCYRRQMIRRNSENRDAMTLARETGRSARRRSSLEVRAEELFSALGIEFQPNFAVGRFVADFYVPAYNAVIEVYGPLHRKYADAIARDQERERVVKAAGYRFVILSDLDMHLWWRLLRDGLSMSGT